MRQPKRPLRLFEFQSNTNSAGNASKLICRPGVEQTLEITQTGPKTIQALGAMHIVQATQALQAMQAHEINQTAPKPLRAPGAELLGQCRLFRQRKFFG